MNKEESFALFAKGRDAWNAWAATMSTEREALEAAGTWIEGWVEAEWNDATRAWHAAAAADFAGRIFRERVNFSSFVFPDRTMFSEATFSRGAKFDGATFSGDADFINATFSGDTAFGKATFSGDAWFNDASFSGGALFSEVTFSGRAMFRRVAYSEEAEFIEATFLGGAGFGKARFLDNAEFREARFLGDASFGETKFSGDAEFHEVTFSGRAWFNKAAFSGDVWLDEATFARDVWFSEATFSNGVDFNKATFSGDAQFPQVAFGGFTRFTDTRFEKSADFRAIDGKGGFSLSGATFLAVLDFIQAHFAEAPRLDNSRIQPWRFGLPTVAEVKNYFTGDRNLAARWRALKRLAVQGHDHMHELEFFKNELETRRWITDRPWHAVFWFGLFYGWLSDFGRSIVRPLFWWAASAWAFAGFYLYAAKAPLHCLAGPGDPWRAALWISARKALLFFGLDSSDKLTQHYTCLYGVIPTTTSGQLPAGVYLDVPDSVIAFGIAQHIISAALLFLLLLAVRNHFRIK